MKIKIISALFSALLILSSCADKTVPQQSAADSFEMMQNAEIITIDSEPASLKRKANIAADNMQVCFKTEKINTDYGQTEYFIKTNDNKNLFSVTAADPENISDKSFRMLAIYDFENRLLGYIQSDVFRGNESYIIYSDNKEKYAFCDIERNSDTFRDEYKIISFDDELLYKINVSNPEDDEFDMTVERMRPDYKTDISALALAFIINTDEYNHYYEMKAKQENSEE